MDGHQVERPKPFPDVYLRAAQLLGIDPRNCIVFEDSPIGIAAARAAGTHVVGIGTDAAALPAVDLLIRDFTTSGTQRGIGSGTMAPNCRTSILTLFGWVLLGSLVSSQIRFLTLEQAASRTGPNLAPAYQGEEIAVVGQVSARPLWTSESFVLPVQDSAAYGLLIDGSTLPAEGFSPGDWVQARGVIKAQAGLPILAVQAIQRFQTLPPPAPRPVVIAEINSDRYLGVLVTTEGVVSNLTETSSGNLLTIGEKPDVTDVFLPKGNQNDGGNLSTFHRGDRVRVTGIATQYCSNPPYNRGYRVLLSDLSGIALIGRAASSSPGFLLAAGILIAGLLITWWIRERRMSAHRRGLNALNQLVEGVVAATSPAEIINKLNSAVPAIWEGAEVSLYLFNKGSKLLESVSSAAHSRQLTIHPESPEGPLATGVALCLRNRTLLAVPDTRRSPFVKLNGEKDMPRSLMFVPMFAQNELLGVMEVAYSKREHRFGHEEQAATQHLANQVATALRLQDQKSIREQLFRSERLAAGGQLISGVAAELRSPLSSILECITTLKERRRYEDSTELEAIRKEAERASEIVARLLSFGKIGKMEAHPVDLNALLLALLRFRARERKQKGIEILPQILNETSHGSRIARAIGAGLSQPVGACRTGRRRGSRYRDVDLNQSARKTHSHRDRLSHPYG